MLAGASLTGLSHFQHHTLLQSILHATAKVRCLNVSQIILLFCLKHFHIHITPDGTYSSILTYYHSLRDPCDPSLHSSCASHPPLISPSSLLPAFQPHCPHFCIWNLSHSFLSQRLYTCCSLCWASSHDWLLCHFCLPKDTFSGYLSKESYPYCPIQSQSLSFSS